MAARGDIAGWKAAFAVLERHGDDALAFAAERLAFCRSTGFADGIVLWSDILARLTVLIDQASPDRGPDGD